MTMKSVRGAFMDLTIRVQMYNNSEFINITSLKGGPDYCRETADICHFSRPIFSQYNVQKNYVVVYVH